MAHLVVCEESFPGDGTYNRTRAYVLLDQDAFESHTHQHKSPTAQLHACRRQQSKSLLSKEKKNKAKHSRRAGHAQQTDAEQQVSFLSFVLFFKKIGSLFLLNIYEL